MRRTLKLVAVPMGNLSDKTLAQRNLEKFGIEIEVRDDKRVLAHEYAGNWKYLGPPKKARSVRRKAKKSSSRR
jgi:hypothetical protein